MALPSYSIRDNRTLPSCVLILLPKFHVKNYFSLSKTSHPCIFTSTILTGDLSTLLTVSNDDSVFVFVSESDAVSNSHQGDIAPPSEAVTKEEDLDGGVHVHSEAVTNSSADLLSLDVFEVFAFFPGLHSWNCKNKTWRNMKVVL